MYINEIRDNNQTFTIDVNDYSPNEKAYLNEKGKKIDYEALKAILPTITVNNKILNLYTIAAYFKILYVRIGEAFRGEKPWLLFLIYQFILNHIDNPKSFEALYEQFKSANFELKNLEEIEVTKEKVLKKS